ncbi:MAG: GAF domain-containing protein [Clostridioides sp.]|jgi:GAF domain-containing protein|nr:GAF domain-containing protein [Clostridioides sp.]
MSKIKGLEGMDKEEKYKFMLMMLEGQLRAEKDIYANISNASAIIYSILDNLNWSGFYLMRGGELVLGPFQGMPACNRIAVGRGVCGTAVSTKQVQRVDDVHKFPGHIACDSASNSEIVVPIVQDGVVYGVLDIDSFEFSNFTDLEEKYLVEFVDKLNEYIDWRDI